MIFSSEEQTNSSEFETTQNSIDPQVGRIFVSQLPHDLGEKDIIAIFGEYGAINDMRIVPASHFQSQKSMMFIYKLFTNFPLPFLTIYYFL